jgi:hypothetical protein
LGWGQPDQCPRSRNRGGRDQQHGPGSIANLSPRAPVLRKASVTRSPGWSASDLVGRSRPFFGAVSPASVNGRRSVWSMATTSTKTEAMRRLVMAAAAAAAAVALGARRAERSGGPGTALSSPGRASRTAAVSGLSARLGTTWAPHRARRTFASAARREELDRTLELATRPGGRCSRQHEGGADEARPDGELPRRWPAPAGTREFGIAAARRSPDESRLGSPGRRDRPRPASGPAIPHLGRTPLASASMDRCIGPSPTTVGPWL